MTDRMNEIVAYEVNGNAIEITKQDVKNYLVSGNGEYVTDQELQMFLSLCQYQQINPWLKEAYLIKYSKTDSASIVVGKEFYLKRAQQQPDFSHLEAGLILQRDRQLIEVEGSFKLKTDALLGGWAKVYKKGNEKPFVAKVSIEEYSTGKSLWNQKPSTMIRKVAIVQALREAYTEQLGALYIEEEQRPINMQEVKSIEKEETPKEKRKSSTVARKQTIKKQEPIEDEEIIIEAEYEEVQEQLASKQELEALLQAMESVEMTAETMKEEARKRYGKDSSKELTSDEIQELILWIVGSKFEE